MVNQFSPTEEEIKAIIEQNKTLPQLEKTCYKCGHKPCPSCETWCDTFLWNTTMQGNWEDYDKEDIQENGDVSPPHCCCDGKCSYE